MSNFEVLLVDDEFGQRQVLTHALQRIRPDLKITRAGDPDQALRYFEEHRNEAKNLPLISDNNMGSANYQETNLDEKLETILDHCDQLFSVAI